MLLSSIAFAALGIMQITAQGLPGLNPPPMMLNAPLHVHTTTKLDECASHLGSSSCASALKRHDYIVVWDWSNGRCPYRRPCGVNVDGYRVFANRKLVGTVLVDQGTGLALDPKQVGTPCFSVSAFSGSDESERSDTFCVNQGNATPGRQTKAFTPVHMQSVEKAQPKSTMARRRLR